MVESSHRVEKGGTGAMLSILHVDPPIKGTPTEPLGRAVQALLVTSEAAYRDKKKLVENNFRVNLIARAVPDAVQFTMPLEQFKAAIILKLKRAYGGGKGPVQNAFNELDYFAKRAQTAGYFLRDKDVQEKFADFLMLYVTEGMTGADTTGTQMGNFQGTWRGGGF